MTTRTPRGRKLGIGYSWLWMEKGSCCPDRLPADVLREFFFADLSMRTEDRLKATAAKGVCQHCVIRKECLDFALVHHEDGIWGGLDARERADLTGYSVRVRKLQIVMDDSCGEKS